eukprot:2983197-Alexandrium_andersonii.AAC.1
MSASLVGSEMCIRDSVQAGRAAIRLLDGVLVQHCAQVVEPVHLHVPFPVSYTHLTLPTICSV